MAENTNSLPPTPHPIKLIGVHLAELYIRAIPQSTQIDPLKPVNFNFSAGHSEYNKETHRLAIFIKIEVGTDEKQLDLYKLKVELIGEFEVDEVNFPIEKIDSWANNNAPLILMPYVREQVYSLTMRCGFPPLLLPLVIVPTINVESK